MTRGRRDLCRYLLAAYLGALLSAIAHTLLKFHADRTSGEKWHAVYFRPLALIAILLFLAATLSSLYAYTRLPLKSATIVLPFNYLVVGGFSYLLLKERMSFRQWIGALIIVLGVIVFNL